MDNAKRQAALAHLLDKGRTALRSKRYAEAIDAFQAVLNVAPNDREARQGLADATKARDQVKAEFTRYMTAAAAAFQLQRYEEAATNYRAALNILPDDPDAQRGLRQLNQAVDALNAAAIALPRYLVQGQAALDAGRYADAVIAFNEALRIDPLNAVALSGLNTANQAIANAAQQVADANRQLQQAQRALQLKQYADAIRGFKAILQIQANNQAAIDGLHQARYGKAMADGRQAMLARRYADAVSFFEAALQEVPGDNQAMMQLRLAKQWIKSK